MRYRNHVLLIVFLVSCLSISAITGREQKTESKSNNKSKTVHSHKKTKEPNPPETSDTSQIQIDYVKRVQFVHNLVCEKIPQALIDSIAHVNHYILDSIRIEITKHRDKDSISFLKTAIDNALNDSFTLVGINSLVNNHSKDMEYSPTKGTINAYCIDLNSQTPIDSVKVSVFNHDSFIAFSYSSHDGFCKIMDLMPGEYSISFSKNNYTSFSDRWVKVTAGNVTYLEMPLSETPRFNLPKFSAQIWAMIVLGVISLFLLIYSIIRRLERIV